MTDTAASQPNLRVVLAEIDADVRARRASGDLPADFERRLDAAFARFAPVDAVSGDFKTLLDKLEESTTFDTRAPVMSATRGVAQVKTLIGKAIDWDLRHLAAQASGATHALTRALGLLGSRVEDLERDAPSGGDARLWDLGLGALRPELPPGDWVPILVGFLSGATGPVVHAEAGVGATVRALNAAGIAAYGVDPDEHLAVTADGSTDLRPDGARAHLRALPTASVGGVVLSGCVDRWTPGAILDAVDLAHQRLGSGGRLAVLSHDPETWAADGGAVADLADGHPWAPATWQTVLERRGFAEVRVEPGQRGFAVLATR